MKRHKLLIGVIRFLAILMVIMSILITIKSLSFNVWPAGAKHGDHQYTIGFGLPDIGLLPAIWRFAFNPKLWRGIMVGLSFLGGIEIGILLLNNRGKVRKLLKKGMAFSD